MAAVRHLGFVTSSHRTTHEVFSLGHIGLPNFMLIRCIILKIWRFESFADLAWNAYSRPKNFGFWGSEPLNVIGHHRDPQKAPPWPKTHLHANFGAYRSTGATCVRDEEIKKARKETYSGKLGVRPDHPRWRSDMWSCMPVGLRELVIRFKFRQNRMNRFWDVGGRILPFPIPKASGLYNCL